MLTVLELLVQQSSQSWRLHAPMVKSLWPLPVEQEEQNLLGSVGLGALSQSVSSVAQSCLTLSDPMDCSLPGSSVHGIFQARVLELGVIAFSQVLMIQKKYS